MATYTLFKIPSVHTVGEEKISFYPSRSFGWSNNQMNLRQINRRKINLITYIQGPHKNRRHTGRQSGNGGLYAILN